MNNLTFLTSDLKKIKISSNFIYFSSFVKDIVEEFPGDDIPLPGIHSITMYKIIEFWEYYINKPFKHIEILGESIEIKDYVSEWYANFLNSLGEELLVNMMNAADYMQISVLLDLLCAFVAQNIRHKTPERIRRLFNLDDDLDISEKQGLIESNTWIDE